MADFSVLSFQLNTGTQATPVWTTVAAWAGSTFPEIRWSDLSTQGAVAGASWPYITRPGSATLVSYVYAFSADTTSLGLLGTSSTTPLAWANANYNQARWNWDNTGTFASAPIYTAYKDNTHGAITRGDNALLGGNTTDTGATQRSYLKGQMYGSGATTQVPAAAPTNAPVITDGTTGSLSPGAGAWLTNYQGLQGDNDYITYGSTPTALTAQQLYVMFAIYLGPNLSAGTYVYDVAALKYNYG